MVGKSARLLAPIALIAVAFGVYLVVHSTLAPHSTPATRTSAIVESTRRHAIRKAKHTPRFYVVKSGDTLSGISEKTGVSVSTLTTLNPALSASPNSLSPGQRVRLRPGR
ncbi:MAG TPA: LysM domain-containing protein [Solirubrobacteraceae bacterium]|jgi:LysM repeat protein|nr:LysM domain-containing protein [Solirubrobacteraceae bacterium]